MTIDRDALDPLVYLVFLSKQGISYPNAHIELLERVVEDQCVKAQRERKTDVAITGDVVLKFLQEECNIPVDRLLQILIQKKDEANGLYIPASLNSYVQPMRFEALAFQREEELKELIEVLLQERTNNIVITGKAGVGKTYLVETLSHLLFLARTGKGGTQEEKALLPLVKEAKNLFDTRFLELEPSSLVGDENKLGLLIKALSNAVKEQGMRIVLFIDEFHDLFKPDGRGKLKSTLLEALKPVIASSGNKKDGGRLTIIGATNEDQTIDEAFGDAEGRRFETIHLSELNEAQMEAITKRQYPDSMVTKQVRSDLYRLKDKLRPGFVNPDATLYLLDKVKTGCKKEKKGEAIDRSHLKAYLEDHYCESWDDYWVPLLDGNTHKIVRQEREEKLTWFRWTVFKVQQLFFNLLGKQIKTPKEIIEQQVPFSLPRSKRGNPLPAKEPEPKVANVEKILGDALQNLAKGSSLSSIFQTLGVTKLY